MQRSRLHQLPLERQHLHLLRLPLPKHAPTTFKEKQRLMSIAAAEAVQSVLLVRNVSLRRIAQATVVTVEHAALRPRPLRLLCRRHAHPRRSQLQAQLQLPLPTQPQLQLVHQLRLQPNPPPINRRCPQLQPPLPPLLQRLRQRPPLPHPRQAPRQVPPRPRTVWYRSN